MIKNILRVRILLNESIEECNETIRGVQKKYESELENAQNKEEFRLIKKKIDDECFVIYHVKRNLLQIRFLWRIFPFTCIDGYRLCKDLLYGMTRCSEFSDPKSYEKCQSLVSYYVADYEKKRGFLYYTMWCIYVLIALIILSIIIVNNS